MKTLLEHAAELRRIAGEHFDYTIPASGPRVDTHDWLCDAADALEQAAEVLRAVEWAENGPVSDLRYCPACNESENVHAPDCKLAALIGAKS